MDAQRFDRLTQRLTARGDRRRLGAMLAPLGLAVGMMLAPWGLTGGEAKKRKNKKKKCEACRTTIRCLGREVNPETDPENCGECGNACLSGACLNGRCRCESLSDCPASCSGCFQPVGSPPLEKYCAGGSTGILGCASNAECGRYGICTPASSNGSFCQFPCFG